MNNVDRLFKELATVQPHFYETPPTPSTENRITLERIRADAMQLQTIVQELLKGLRFKDSKD